MPIATRRLDLRPMKPGFIRASLSGDLEEASRWIGADLPPDWPDIPEILRMRLDQLDADAALEPWLLRAMILRETEAMIGYIGFHTAPGPEYLEPWSPGAVELGFTVFPVHRRNGYAAEAACGLIDWAETQGVKAFIVTVSPGNIPSQALVARLGFRRIGEHLDEIDGVEEVLEFRPTR